MPRSTSNSRSSSKSYSSVPKSVQKVTSKPIVSVPPTSHVVPVQAQAPGLMSSMKEGFGLGVGLSVARNLVDGIFGSKEPAQPPPMIQAPPAKPLHLREYTECIQEGGTEDSCKKFLYQS